MVEENKKNISARVNSIKAQIEETTSDYDKRKNYKKDLQNYLVELL